MIEFPDAVEHRGFLGVVRRVEERRVIPKRRVDRQPREIRIVFLARSESRSMTIRRISSSGTMAAQRMSVAPRVVPAATGAATAPRSAGTSAHNENATISGGMAAGMMIGQRYGDMRGEASRSPAISATMPETGMRMSAASAAGHGISPLIQAMNASSASSPQSTMVIMAA